MMSVTKILHPQQKKYFSSAIYQTGRSIWALEQLSSAIGGGARALVRQPKTAVFQAKIKVRIYRRPALKVLMTCQRIFAIVPFNQMKENILMGKCCLAQIFYWFRLIFTFWSKYLQTTSWAPLPYINGRRLCDTWYGNTHLYQHNVEISNKICKLSAYKNNHQLFKKHVFMCC